MKTRYGIALLALVLAGCGPALQPNAELSPASRALQPPPISALIGYRTALELTSAQVTTLDSIGEATRLRNSELFAQLRERREAPSDTTSPTAPQAILGEIRASNRKAAQAVSEVLTETQRSRTCDLFARSRAERAERDGAARARPARRTRGELADSLFAPPRPWPWCQSTLVAPAQKPGGQ